MDSFWACFFCSCVVQSGVLLAAKNYQLSKIASLIIILSMVLMIKIIKPVEHANRPLEANAKKYFQKKLNMILRGIFFGSIILFAVDGEKYLSLSALTMIVIVASMIIGKWKQKFDNRKRIDL